MEKEKTLEENTVSEEIVEETVVESVEPDESASVEHEEAIVPCEGTDVVEATVSEPLVAKKDIKEIIASIPMKTKRIIAGGVLLVVVALVLLITLVIRPANIYKDAVNALESKNFTECQRLIDKIPNYSKVPDLRVELTYEQAVNYVDNKMLDEAEALLVGIANYSKTKELKDEIIYKRAAIALGEKDYKKAEEYLSEIPDHADPDSIRNKLKYEQAFEMLEQGNYVDAYATFDELGDYEDSKDQLDIVYYEAYALKYLLKFQPNLKNPSSLRVSEVDFYVDDNDSYCAIIEYTGTNTYGGTVGSYLYAYLYDEDDSYFTISHSDYADPEDLADSLYAYIISSTKEEDTDMGIAVDVTRMNRLFENKADFKIDLDFTKEDVAES